MNVKAVQEFLETWGERAIFASRWLLAPIYLGLAVGLLALVIVFMKELFHLVTHLFTSTEIDVILAVLALVDIAMTGSLLIIVIFSGYENFVSKIDHSGHVDWPEWMGTIDFAALKLKLLSSIVAISAIQLLKEFMSIKQLTDADERKLFWLAVIHMVFVGSSVLLALSDRIAEGGKGHGGSNGKGNGAGHGSPDTNAPDTKAKDK
ncbi:MAG: TIGR00645 family protein [Hyphomicrobium aestuarii]|nr:TIGR00645 family protein [Hyphomicrobium aestuarii]